MIDYERIRRKIKRSERLLSIIKSEKNRELKGCFEEKRSFKKFIERVNKKLNKM